MGDLFLITSVINTGNNPWSYSSRRSVYSTEERFTQTLQTILSIRKKVPNSKIFLLECSDLSEEMKEELVFRVDYFLNLYSDEFCRSACLESNKKGFGEAVQTAKAVEFLVNNNILPKRFFKISGRYYLNEEFNLENYSSTEFTFKKHVLTGTGMKANSTVIYSFPICYLEHFYKCLISIIQYYLTNEPRGYEELLPALCEPKIEIEIMGVSGFVAIAENDFFTC